jgi:hypothetical protein
MWFCLSRYSTQIANRIRASPGMVTRLNRRALYPYLLLGPSPSKRADAIAGGAKIEKRDSYRVERFVMSASEILDGPEYWPGNTHHPVPRRRGDDRPTGRAPRYIRASVQCG